MCIIIIKRWELWQITSFFLIALLYIYIYFYKRCYVSNHPDTQHKMVDWISEGKKKKRKELIQPDPVINRRDLKWLDLGGDLIRLFLFRLIFLYINIQHFIYYICNVKILKSRFEVFRPFGFRVATADRPSPLRKPGLWRGISDLAQVLHLTEPSVSIRAWDRRWS